jgi:hypothetical protein
MQPTFTPATTTEPGEVIIPSTDLEVNSVFSNLLSGVDLGFISIDSVLSWIGVLWSIYAIFAYIFSIILLVLYVYASTRKRQLEQLREEMVAEREKIYDERYRSAPKNNRLQDVITHISADSPNDWKLAIIEADIILDGALKDAGYAGTSLGERLRSITPSQLQSLDDAWQAHKVRNQVAHGGADFILTRRLAEDTIKQYRRAFKELGVE